MGEPKLDATSVDVKPESSSQLAVLRTHIQKREAVRWRDEYCMLIVAFAEKNPNFRATNHQIAEFIGCTERAIYKWRNEHPDFDVACREAQQIVVDRCLEGLWESALGAMSMTQRTTTRPDGTVTTETITRRDPPNPQASMFLLKNLRPDEWKDRRDVDVVSDGEPIRPVILFAESKKQHQVVDVTPEKIEGDNDGN